MQIRKTKAEDIPQMLEIYEKAWQYMRTKRKGMNNIKAIIFDLDGTLLDTLQDLQAAVNFALKKHGMPERTLDEIRQFVGNGVRRLMELSVPEGEKNLEFEAAFADFKAYYSEHNLDFTKPYDGILDALKTLKEKGLRMAIVSNKLEEATEALRQHFFADYIETAVGDAPERQRKPAPDGVFEAIRRLGVTKDECVYVGDSDVDFRTAQNSGLPCISVLWGFRDRAFLESLGATVFCEKPQELYTNFMTEKEKRNAGLLYDANNDPEIFAEILRAHDICYDYNHLRPSQIEEREKIIRGLFGKTGKSFYIEQPFCCDFGYNIEIGEKFYANIGCMIIDCAKVSFGDNVFIAPYCGFYTAGHAEDPTLRKQGIEYARPITVGNGVWIGANSSILPGVTIGDNSIVGAGSVVTHDIPANEVWAGNPARFIRKVRVEEDNMI